METKQTRKISVALRSLTATLAVGFILFFFSETAFWGRPGRASVAELVVTWLVYSAMTYLFLSAVRAFRVTGGASLFLAGALYGWLGEGVLVQTMYDAFPLNLSWTGLAWHSLISVCAGWRGMNLALQRGAVPATLAAAGLGVFWGVWAVMWWQKGEGGNVVPFPAFAAHAFTQGVLLMLAYALAPRLLTPEAYTSRVAQGIFAAIVLLWFAFVAVPANSLALAVAPPLFALTLFLLRRHRRTTEEPDLLTALRPVPPLRCLPVLAMPLTAIAVYALFLQTGQTYPTNLWVFYVVTPLGFIGYGVSAWRTFRDAPRPA